MRFLATAVIIPFYVLLLGLEALSVRENRAFVEDRNIEALDALH